MVTDDGAAAREPAAVAQHRARAAYSHRHERHAGLRRDHEGAHAKRQQARAAGEGPFGEKNRRASGAHRSDQARSVFCALLDVGALDEVGADGTQEQARQEDWLSSRFAAKL